MNSHHSEIKASDTITAHTKLRELLKTIGNTVLTKRLDELLAKQIASYDALLLEPDPALRLTMTQLNQLHDMFSSMLQIIGFSTTLVQLAETQRSAFQKSADHKHCAELKIFSDKFSSQVAKAHHEYKRLYKLAGDIVADRYVAFDCNAFSDEISPEKQKAFRDKQQAVRDGIQQSADRNLLDDDTDFSSKKKKKLISVRNREKEIREEWHECVKKTISSQAFLLLIPTLLTQFTSNEKLMAELTDYSKVLSTVKTIESSSELASFRQTFHLWRETTHSEKMNMMHLAFELLSYLETGTMAIGRSTISPELKNTLDAHDVYKPGNKKSDATVNLIHQTIIGFNQFEKTYLETKQALVFREKEQAAKAQKKEKNAAKPIIPALGNTSTVATLVKIFDPEKSQTHRRRSSSISNNEAPPLQRMTTSSKLTIHYRPTPASPLSAIVEESESSSDRKSFNAKKK